MQTATNSNLLALDVGQARIGVAVASSVARLPRPLTTLVVDATIVEKIAEIVKAEEVGEVIVGLPRGMNGQETDQTKITRNFAEGLKTKLDIPVHLQDEALTSKKAEKELAGLKNPGNLTVDSLAATYILEDFLLEGNAG